MNDFSSRGTQSSLKPYLPYGIDIWTLGPLYYLYDPYVCGNRNKFLVPLSGRYGLVWIDILAKDKFANLKKKIYFHIFFCILFVFSLLHFVFVFSYRCFA